MNSYFGQSRKEILMPENSTMYCYLALVVFCIAVKNKKNTLQLKNNKKIVEKNGRQPEKNFNLKYILKVNIKIKKYLSRTEDINTENTKINLSSCTREKIPGLVNIRK